MVLTHKGARIFYTDQGQGDPIVLLHGFLENHTMWDAFLPELIRTHRVICIDLLGHGQSECIGYIHTMKLMAEGVQTVLTHLKLDQVTIIGHSMGGYVGCAFAKAYPKKLHALCLLNSTPEADNEDRKLLRTRANKMAKTQYEQLVRMSFVNLFDPQTKVKHALAIEQALDQALQTPVQGYIAANSGMRLRTSSSEVWESGNFKKGMILGENDWIIDAQSHLELYQKHCDIFSIIEGGHMSHLGNSDNCLTQLLDFLTIS